MRRLLGPAALVATFLLGWAAAGITRYTPWTSPEVAELRETVTRQQQQVAALQARLHTGHDRAFPRGPGAR